MATEALDTYDMTGALVIRETWSNGTQMGETAGYVKTDGAGVVLAQRALTDDETARLAADDTANLHGGNRKVLQGRATAALTANAAFIAAVKPSTTAAQASAAYDQTVRLTKECSALIRLLLSQLDTTDGT